MNIILLIFLNGDVAIAKYVIHNSLMLFIQNCFRDTKWKGWGCFHQNFKNTFWSMYVKYLECIIQMIDNNNVFNGYFNLKLPPINRSHKTLDKSKENRKSM